MVNRNNHLVFEWIVSIALFIAVIAIGVGGYFFWQLDLKNKELLESKKDLENKLAISQNNLATTTNALQEERTRNDAFANQLSGLATTVGTLDKLSKTDRELLKKYSKIYFLSENYIPSNLATITPQYLFDPEKSLLIHASVLPKLESLIRSASSVGITLQINSAYRSFGTQEALKYNYSVTYGAGTANKFSADQGYSEHQLGTTIDFGTPSIKGDLSKFGKTDAYNWLTNNAYRFGFVLSYPEDNDYYQYEPWHWRYVGVALATKLHFDKLHFYDFPQRLIDQFLVNIFD